MELLKILSETPAAPGREHRVRELIRENVAQHADRIEVDALGNMICFKAATNPGSSPPKKVMLSCHMDEIAFYVRSVDEDGFIQRQTVTSVMCMTALSAIRSWWAMRPPFTRMRLTFRKRPVTSWNVLVLQIRCNARATATNLCRQKIRGAMM